MSAKEMFEKLGYHVYEKHNDDGNFISYLKYDNYENWGNIIFYCDTKTFSIGERLYCDIRILQAINKQVEELRWLEEVEE